MPSSSTWRRHVEPAAAAVVDTAAEGYSNTQALGELLYTKYLYPFELAAMLLLLAIVAAITLTMRQRRGAKTQDIGAQVAVRAKDRIRLVKMNAETDAANAAAEIPADLTVQSAPAAVGNSQKNNCCRDCLITHFSAVAV